MSLSKNINPSLVLVQPRKTRPLITEILLMGRNESNQTNKQTNKHPTLGIIQDPIAQNAFDTRCSIILMAFLIIKAYLQSLNSRTLSMFTTAAQSLHQWSECHAMFLAKTRCERGGRETISLLKTSIELPRSNDHVYICLFCKH